MRFSVDHKGIAAMKREPFMHVSIQAAAEVVAETIPALAPHRSGHYDASIDAVHMGYADARARVYVRDFKWNWIEFGAGPSPVRGGRTFPARGPMRRACIVCGLRFVPAARGVA
ncbi:hypothetical protein GCM10029976_090940 [Kribbella albertanoniae]|uniref:hypothetical protein n=1 Tax=Kribbella albertanoniae TaxID=1266829 RepID=UPI0014052619|nr:hypothetical protein [Kribbella albertanoniae]